MKKLIELKKIFNDINGDGTFENIDNISNMFCKIFEKIKDNESLIYKLNSQKDYFHGLCSTLYNPALFKYIKEPLSKISDNLSDIIDKLENTAEYNKILSIEYISGREINKRLMNIVYEAEKDKLSKIIDNNVEYVD